MYLLDTNVISELMKPEPDSNVTLWVESQSIKSLFITAITQADVLYGLMILPESRRKNRLLKSTISIRLIRGIIADRRIAEKKYYCKSWPQLLYDHYILLLKLVNLRLRIVSEDHHNGSCTNT